MKHIDEFKKYLKLAEEEIEDIETMFDNYEDTKDFFEYLCQEWKGAEQAIRTLAGEKQEKYITKRYNLTKVLEIFILFLMPEKSNCSIELIQKNLSAEEIAQITYNKAINYYRGGKLYKYAGDSREYVLNMFEKYNNMAYFESVDGFEIHIPWNMLGVFLPCVARTGSELIKVD